MNPSIKVIFTITFFIVFICLWLISGHLIDKYHPEAYIIMTIGAVYGMMLILVLELIDRLRI